ncbi:MAG TPA: C39 family peptidase [Micromonospora sp.]|nr:C39 family peptidase [Micromonospora sp.]
MFPLLIRLPAEKADSAMELSVEERPTPEPFWRAAPRRVNLFAIASAAVVGIAATTGVLENHAPSTVTAHTAAVAGAISTGSGSSSPAPASPGGTQTDPEATETAKPKPPSKKVLKYDFQYQPNFYYCGPATTRIALTSQGFSLSQDALAKQLHTTVNGTDSVEDTTRVLNNVIGKDVYESRWIPGPGATPAEMDRLQADVVNAISNGRAVVANIVGGATDNAGYWRDFPGGHYVTIVGYSDDGRQVQIADPSGIGPAAYWMSTIDMAKWMGSRGYSA